MACGGSSGASSAHNHSGQHDQQGHADEMCMLHTEQPMLVVFAIITQPESSHKGIIIWS
jgi:hypothetical protein